jgi:formate/nitrite transporter FocA (FNT family)
MSESSRGDARPGSAHPISHHEAAGATSPHLDEEEKGQAAAHSSPHALVLHEIIREEGEAALSRTVGALMWSSLAAGLSMGFSFLMVAVLDAGMNESPSRHLISSFGYTVGFVLVILGRQQLFTESTLTVVLPVLTRQDLPTLLKALRLWVIVLICNLLGTWAYAALLLTPDVLPPPVVAALYDVAHHTTSPHNFLSTMVGAMFAGWLIALMVWLLPSARSGRLLTVLLITYVVSAARLDHIVAGSTEAAYMVLLGESSFQRYVAEFLAPVLAGNSIGGIALVALLNHAAIAPEIGK